MESSELERFEAVVLPHLDAAYTLARYLTRSDHDAQDVVQDASLRAFRHFGSFRGAGSGEGRAWLLAIVRNTAYTWQRRHHGDTLTTEFDEEQHSEAVTGEDPEAAVVAQGQRVELGLEGGMRHVSSPPFARTALLRAAGGRATTAT